MIQSDCITGYCLTEGVNIIGYFQTYNEAMTIALNKDKNGKVFHIQMVCGTKTIENKDKCNCGWYSLPVNTIEYTRCTNCGYL